MRAGRPEALTGAGDKAASQTYAVCPAPHHEVDKTPLSYMVAGAGRSCRQAAERNVMLLSPEVEVRLRGDEANRRTKRALGIRDMRRVGTVTRKHMGGRADLPCLPVPVLQQV